MRALRDVAAVAALDDLELRQVVERRIREIEDTVAWNADTVGFFIVVEPGDSIEALEAESGCSILKGYYEDTRFGEEGFSPSFEWMDEYESFYEAVWILNDDGFGIDFFIPKQPGIDPDLLAMCATYAKPASPLFDTMEGASST